MMGIEKLTIICSCGDPSHSVTVSWHDDPEWPECYIEVVHQTPNIWHRIGMAWRYVIGRDSCLVYADVQVDPDDAGRLSNLFGRFGAQARASQRKEWMKEEAEWTHG